MKKIIMIGTLLAVAGFTATAFATVQMTGKPDGTNSNGSNVGVYSSRVTGNGGSISGNDPNSTTDNTTGPGTRSAAVHDAQINGDVGNVPPGQAKKQ